MRRITSTRTSASASPCCSRGESRTDELSDPQSSPKLLLFLSRGLFRLCRFGRSRFGLLRSALRRGLLLRGARGLLRAALPRPSRRSLADGLRVLALALGLRRLLLPGGDLDGHVAEVALLAVGAPLRGGAD